MPDVELVTSNKLCCRYGHFGSVAIVHVDSDNPRRNVEADIIPLLSGSCVLPAFAAECLTPFQLLYEAGAEVALVVVDSGTDLVRPHEIGVGQSTNVRGGQTNGGLIPLVRQIGTFLALHRPALIDGQIGTTASEDVGVVSGVALTHVRSGTWSILAATGGVPLTCTHPVDEDVVRITATAVRAFISSVEAKSETPVIVVSVFSVGRILHFHLAGDCDAGVLVENFEVGAEHGLLTVDRLRHACPPIVNGPIGTT